MVSEYAEIFVVNDIVKAIRDGGRKYNRYRGGSQWVVEEFSRSTAIVRFRSLRQNGHKGTNVVYIGNIGTAFSDFTKRGTWSENDVRFTA